MKTAFQNQKFLASWILLAQIFYFFSTNAFANQTTFTEIRSTIRDDIREVMSGLDPDALVSVEVIPEVLEKTALPGTNVTMDEVLLTDESNLPKIKAVNILILTSIKELPKAAVDIIKKNAGAYSKTINLELQARIPGFKKNLGQQPPPPPPPPTPVAKDQSPLIPPINFPKLDLEPISSPISTLGRQLVTGIFVLAGAGILVLFVLVDLARQNRKQLQAVISGTQGLVQALESGSLGSGGGSSLPVAERPSLPGGGANSGIDVLTEMSDAGIAAIISDAYWCKQDAYASAIWRRLSLGRKQILLNGLPFAKEYVTYLSSIPEGEGTWEQHPYYMNPLPIWTIDNASLAEIVKSSASLLSMLPPMRLSNLPLQTNEIIALRQSQTELALPVPDLSMMPASEFRTLNDTIRVTSRSDEDDQKLMAITDVSISDMRQVITLVWILRLKDEQVKEIIKSFSATDLASAWIGPPQVINRLETALPERKLKIVKSYAEKIKPSRSSPAYQDLHEQIVNELGKQVKDDKRKTTEERENNSINKSA